MSSILWRCHRFSTSTEQWISRLCEGDGGSYFMKDLCVFLKRVTVTVIAAILKEIAGWGWYCCLEFRHRDAPVRTNLENASRRLYTANSRTWGRPCTWMPKYGCRRSVWRGVACASESRVHVEAEGIANPWHPVYSACYLCDVHNNAVCSDRGQRVLSDQGGIL